jgi:predicted MFS family arabinose efflux permease
VAFLVGRVAFGYLLDKFHAPRLAVIALTLAALFYTLLATTGSQTVVMMAVVLGGVSAGGEADLLPYLASRYFGEQAVSTVFGWFLCAYVVGAAMGPVSFAQLMTVFQGPSAPLYILTALQLIPAVLFLTLGPYRFKPGQH